MQGPKTDITRRTLLASAAVFGAAAAFPPVLAETSAEILTRPIPKTGEQIPAVGMGTWITFNVGADRALREQRVDVLQAFFDHGGTVIDSSPMYGTSEEVVGYCLERIARRPEPFSATKVWTLLQALGRRQVEESFRLWGVDRFDLQQVHNLLNWESHLETLRAEKEKWRVRYIGITTSHGRRHGDFADLMAKEPLDFVQFTYNILDREAEQRLLPLAADRGLAVLINRPFRQGHLFDLLQGHALPDWAHEIGCANWAQFMLKFVVSHPAVTCVIPATTRVDHMVENMGAMRGPLLDDKMRARMARHVETLI
jgi:diketogulonate reductase-like aldo/keto reductase